MIWGWPMTYTRRTAGAVDMHMRASVLDDLDRCCPSPAMYTSDERAGGLHRRWRRVAPILVLALVAVTVPSESEAQEPVVAVRTHMHESKRPDRRPLERHGYWIVKLFVPEGVDWQPPPPIWRDVPGGKARLAVQAEDGRYVTVTGGGLVDLVLNGEEIRGLRPEPLHLRARYTADEVCAGPILMIVPGRNAAGEETVLRIAGEPADAAWRKRHCKAKR